ncbi:MAG TPA: hypothetical protein VHY32_06225 [Caulobacteraceae bacterium]|jgi:fatty-acyl-CoA synthase|nr:hypothetical protein [Caulobacteraceae bacterium]
MRWNFGDILDAIEPAPPPQTPALIHGPRVATWGPSITAVVRLAPNEDLDEDSLRRHVRKRLAGYKIPKRVLTGEVSLRAPNGKAASEFAREYLRLIG